MYIGYVRTTFAITFSIAQIHQRPTVSLSISIVGGNE